MYSNICIVGMFRLSLDEAFEDVVLKFWHEMTNLIVP